MSNTLLSPDAPHGSETDESGSSSGSDNPPEPEGDQPDAESAASKPTFELEASGRSPGVVESLRQGIEAVIPLLPRPLDRLSVRVVSDAEMTELHGRWKQVARTTDVVTFDLTEEGETAVVVDMAICDDEARRQSVERGHDLPDELLLYVIHGLLHCCGHDDQTVEQAQAMHLEEDRLLERIGRRPISLRGEAS